MDLHHLTATEASEMFRRRELSPVELLDALVARTAQTEPVINAVTEELLDEAYAAARESEGRFARGEGVRALEGIPLMLKDEQPIEGYKAEDGSLLERGRVADVTHPIVDRIRDAGAVIHGRTTTPEFCCAPVTHSKLWGITRNPWNLEITPGGSSGGSGAVLAAGNTVLATGSDIGGSIRIPSAMCGVVGFKPPFGRVPGLPPFNSDAYCADGPMGRSVGDVVRLQNVISGPWYRDQASLSPALRLPERPRPMAGMRVAYCPTLGDYELDDAVAANSAAVAEALRAAGVMVDEVTLPWKRRDVMATAWAHFGGIMGPFITDVAEGDPERLAQFMPYTRAFAGAAAAAGDFGEGLVAEAEFYRPLGEIFESYDALVCPTVTRTTLAAEDPVDDADESFDHLMTLPFNIVGRTPVLAVPSGIAPNGVPTSVQIVGRPYDDETVFRLGAGLESELGLWNRPDWWPTIRTEA